METLEMGRFIGEVYGPGAIDAAWREFSLDDPNAPTFKQAAKHHQLFLPWCFYHWSPGTHADPPAQRFLDQHPAIHPDRRRYIQTCLATPFSFYDVLSGGAGACFHTRDLVTGRECRITHQAHRLPALLKPTDIVYGLNVELDGVATFEGCATLAIPGRQRARLLERVSIWCQAGAVASRTGQVRLPAPVDLL